MSLNPDFRSYIQHLENTPNLSIDINNYPTSNRYNPRRKKSPPINNNNHSIIQHNSDNHYNSAYKFIGSGSNKTQTEIALSQDMDNEAQQLDQLENKRKSSNNTPLTPNTRHTQSNSQKNNNKKRGNDEKADASQ